MKYECCVLENSLLEVDLCYTEAFGTCVESSSALGDNLFYSESTNSILNLNTSV